MIKEIENKRELALLWFLALGNLAFWGFLVLSKLEIWAVAYYLIIQFFVISFSGAILLLLIKDALKHKIRNRVGWILSFLILVPITPFFYLLSRGRLVKN